MIVLSNIRSFPRETLLFLLISVQLTSCFLLQQIILLIDSSVNFKSSLLAADAAVNSNQLTQLTAISVAAKEPTGEPNVLRMGFCRQLRRVNSCLTFTPHNIPLTSNILVTGFVSVLHDQAFYFHSIQFYLVQQLVSGIKQERPYAVIKFNY